MAKINLPSKKPGRDPGPDPAVNYRALLWYLPIALLLLWVWQDVFDAMSVRTILYSEFKQHVGRREVTECEIKENEIVGVIVLRGASDGSQTGPNAAAGGPAGDQPAAAGDEGSGEERREASAEGKTGTGPHRFLFRTIRVEDPNLVAELEAAGVKFAGVRPSLLTQFLVSWVLPLGLIFALWMFLSRRMGAAGQAVLNIGRSKAKLVADRDTGVTFRDVAGCDEAKFELQEIVDFLKNPDRYVKLGARIPKGVLLVGPPGTGKTLLARAVAGEAQVPFFSISGSDFVEMFVGVGAARVRDLFDQATKHAPCIVFIDELDAIGRQRGVHVGAVNDEREQTLNQLLVEMDGFEANVGVILLAATNRPEVLDRALLRPGRFDRQVVVDAPDMDGREAILKVHSRDKPLDAGVDLRKVARGTPGFSGADLANVMNEAALLTARRHAGRITQQDIEEAVEKVVAGPERKSRRLGDEEKKRVAFHEVGHALVSTYSKHADPVHKISIVPRGRAALGYTLQLPTGDQFLMTRSELLDQLKGLLGGRAAEEVVFGEISTGAENDLDRATTLARRMVCMYGMSDKVGLAHCARRPPVFLGDQDSDGQVDCSETTAREIDQEVKQLLDTAYRDAKRILTTHRDQLETVARRLLEKETLDAAEFHRLLNRKEQETGKRE
jgi:cell division protease FtsH